VHHSPSYHFRQRAEFRIWHDINDDIPGARIFYAMFPKGDPRRPVEVQVGTALSDYDSNEARL
jgi:hypothetical protein